MRIDLYFTIIGLSIMSLMVMYIFIADIKRRVEIEQLPVKYYVKIYSIKMIAFILFMLFIIYYLKYISLK